MSSDSIIHRPKASNGRKRRQSTAHAEQQLPTSNVPPTIVVKQSESINTDGVPIEKVAECYTAYWLLQGERLTQMLQQRSCNSISKDDVHLTSSSSEQQQLFLQRSSSSSQIDDTRSNSIELLPSPLNHGASASTVTAIVAAPRRRSGGDQRGGDALTSDYSCMTFPSNLLDDYLDAMLNETLQID